jgi:hypothetical protein
MWKQVRRLPALRSGPPAERVPEGFSSPGMLVPCAVWICSPSQFHADQIKACAAAGKHVFCGALRLSALRAPEC